MNALNDDLIAAHAKGDKHALVTLYASAAKTAQSDNERAFFLTQAYVFALDTDHPDTQTFKSQLTAMGRDAP